MKIWNFGIIGAGLIADFHAKAILSLDNARLVGVCGTNQLKAQKLAEKYGCKKYNDYPEMLCSGDIDVVTIATPSGAHMEPALEAAKYGKHVICEKPLEITLERIDKMIQAHSVAGTCLGGIFNFRFEDTTEVIKKAVDNGRLGTITYAAVYVPWWRNDAYYGNWHGTRALDGGGAMMNQSIHMVDMLQYIMGPISSLASFTSRLGHPQIETEDTAVGIIQFENNALGIIYGTTASYPGQYRRLEITGTKGTIVLVENSLEVWQFAEMNADDELIRQKYGTVKGGGGVADPAAISYIGHAKNIASFLDAMEKGRKFEIDGQEARKAVDIILDMYRSASQQVIIGKKPLL
jgi:UDP-N-acetyl-2-amino-2-deoxyglucuronate dehydrogenase